MADLATQAQKLSAEAYGMGATKQAKVCQQFSRALWCTIPEALWPIELLSNPDMNPAVKSEEEKAWENFDKHGLSTEKRITFKVEDDGGLLAPTSISGSAFDGSLNTGRTQSAKPNPPGNAPGTRTAEPLRPTPPLTEKPDSSSSPVPSFTHVSGASRLG